MLFISNAYYLVLNHHIKYIHASKSTYILVLFIFVYCLESSKRFLKDKHNNKK